MAKKTIADLGDLHGKRVLVRVDFNVPLDKKTGDDHQRPPHPRPPCRRIQHLLDAGARRHRHEPPRPAQGRPRRRTHRTCTMDRVAARFGELLGQPVKKASTRSSARRSTAAVAALKPGEVLVLENLRFDPGEQKNDPDFAAATRRPRRRLRQRRLRHLPQRTDASMVAVPAAMNAGKPRVVGLLVAKELEVLDGLLADPEAADARPSWAGRRCRTRSASSRRCWPRSISCSSAGR